MNTKTIKEQNAVINSLKDECTNELNRVNHYYWPIIAKIKKRRKNLIWYFSLSCCLLVTVVCWLILNEVTNPYWIGLSLGGTGIIMFLVTFFMVKTIKKYNERNNEWEKALVKPEKMKEQMLELSKNTVELMLDSFGTDKDKIKSEIGDSYEDVLDYYNHWVENN